MRSAIAYAAILCVAPLHAAPVEPAPETGGAATPPTAEAAAGVAADEAAPPDAKLLYALGVIMSTGIRDFQLSESEFAQVSAGLVDGYQGRADVAQAMSYDPRLQVLRRARLQVLSEHEKEAGRAYLAAAAALRGAKRTASGLVYVALTEGKGPHPGINDAVRLNYEAKLVDGSVFDSSAARGGPATFLLSNVMPCFTEALQFMRVGGKSRIICPSQLAYGERGYSPMVAPGATIEYDIELLSLAPQGSG